VATFKSLLLTAHFGQCTSMLYTIYLQIFNNHFKSVINPLLILVYSSNALKDVETVRHVAHLMCCKENFNMSLSYSPH